MTKARKIGSVGDVNPVDYGGGHTFSEPGAGGPWLEYFHGLDSYPDELKAKYGERVSILIT